MAAADVAAACADELEREIVRLGEENVAAFVFEPVVGAAGGAVPAPPGYARMVREICDRHGVLMIADEVMCGTGRCGTWRALEHDGVTPDVMAIAKGLGGGYVPLGATLYHDKVAAVLDEVGGPQTGHTFTGHTLACAAGLAVQRIVERDQLVERVRADGPRLMKMIEERFADVEQRRRHPRPRVLRRPRARRRPGDEGSRSRPPTASTCSFAGMRSTTGSSATRRAATSTASTATR